MKKVRLFSLHSKLTYHISSRAAISMKVGLVRGRYFVLKRILYTLGEPGLVCARNLYQVGRPLVPRGFVKCFLRVPQAVGL